MQYISIALSKDDYEALSELARGEDVKPEALVEEWVRGRLYVERDHAER